MGGFKMYLFAANEIFYEDLLAPTVVCRRPSPPNSAPTANKLTTLKNENFRFVSGADGMVISTCHAPNPLLVLTAL